MLRVKSCNNCKDKWVQLIDKINVLVWAVIFSSEGHCLQFYPIAAPGYWRACRAKSEKPTAFLHLNHSSASLFRMVMT